MKTRVACCPAASTAAGLLLLLLLLLQPSADPSSADHLTHVHTHVHTSTCHGFNDDHWFMPRMTTTQGTQLGDRDMRVGK